MTTPVAISPQRRRVIVTGGADGIGRAIARAFHAEGCRVHVLDVDQTALNTLHDTDPDISSATTDVSDRAAVQTAFRKALDAMEGIDVLVNNVGVPGPLAPVEDISDREWSRVMSVNVDGAFYCIREIVPRLKAARAGCILNVITTSVKTGLPLRLPYVVSKSALLAMTMNLARELGPHGIRCNAISPGGTRTARGIRSLVRTAETNGRSFAEEEADMLRFVSMRTWIEPEEIAAACVFLGSSAARHITGQHLSVCGNSEWE